MNIKLNVKLSAYTKGIFPDTSKFITDAQGSIDHDDRLYGRKNDEWVDIKNEFLDQEIIVEEGSGLNLIKLEGNKSSLSIRQKIIKNKNLIIEEDTTYYLTENTPDIYINGGTAFSDGNNEFTDTSEYGQIIIGGRSNIDIILLPLNSKGVYNGN